MRSISLYIMTPLYFPGVLGTFREFLPTQGHLLLLRLHHRPGHRSHGESFRQLRLQTSALCSEGGLLFLNQPCSSFDPHTPSLSPQGLKSTLTDYKAASYMIVGQLTAKVVLEASLVDTLAVLIAKSLLKEPVLAKEGVGCIIVLLQNQKDGAVGPR